MYGLLELTALHEDSMLLVYRASVPCMPKEPALADNPHP